MSQVIRWYDLIHLTLYSMPDQVNFLIMFVCVLVFVLYVRFDSLHPINNLSVIKDRSSWVEPVLS